MIRARSLSIGATDSRRRRSKAIAGCASKRLAILFAEVASQDTTSSFPANPYPAIKAYPPFDKTFRRRR